jgi:protein translocase SecG subunit
MNYIAIAQIVVSIIVIILTLLQDRSSGASGVFGGDGGAVYQQRRGFEKLIFIATIFFTILFAALSVLALVYKP